MKKRITLQWRLTLLTAAMITAACFILTFLISQSATSQMNRMEHVWIEIPLADADNNIMSLEISGELLNQFEDIRNTFLMQSILAMIAVILLISSFTYFLSGKALAPLKRLSSGMEHIQAQNLSTALDVPDSGDEIAQLADAFNNMLKRLDEAFTMQRRFSANAAHELCTPLAVMQTKIDVLRKKEQPEPEEYREVIHMIQTETGHLSHLVNELLEMTSVQTIARNDSISVPALIEEVVCDLTSVAEEKQISLVQQEGNGQLVGNDALIYRAVYNLVENAIKYNTPGGSVTITPSQTEKNVTITIKDTGYGIPEEFQERIFDPFFRVDKSRSRAMGGAGLGLALVKTIAEHHGGTVRVAESSKQGSTIVLTLSCQ